LDVLDIFELTKDVDDKRFKKDLGNRMLLWHGSRLTNFVGIISQGLRIAPPEAPVTGYMFGKVINFLIIYNKGVYFADMVSKSANYCCTSKENPVGLILLCDVACGEFNDKFYADYNA
jgi:poly [ADP-ribose] polymerase